MLIISHRGNLNGPSELENNPLQIATAQKDFYVEVDIWQTQDGVFLGHNEPEYNINVLNFKKKYLQSNKIIYHAKNPAAAVFLEKEQLKWFAHDKDMFAIVNNISRNKVLWGLPNELKGVNNNSLFQKIPVIFGNDFSRYEYELKNNIWYGVCTDYPLELRKFIKENK